MLSDKDVALPRVSSRSPGFIARSASLPATTLPRNIKATPNETPTSHPRPSATHDNTAVLLQTAEAAPTETPVLRELERLASRVDTLQATASDLAKAVSRLASGHHTARPVARKAAEAVRSLQAFVESVQAEARTIEERERRTARKSESYNAAATTTLPRRMPPTHQREEQTADGYEREPPPPPLKPKRGRPKK